MNRIKKLIRYFLIFILCLALFTQDLGYVRRAGAENSDPRKAYEEKLKEAQEKKEELEKKKKEQEDLIAGFTKKK